MPQIKGFLRYFLRLSYFGKYFHGWQRQSNATSIQAHLEEALATLLQIPVTLVGAGRTDAGVHALEMVAHFDVPQALQDLSLLCNRLNKMAGPHVLVREWVAGPEDLHARFDALERRYQYRIVRVQDPFQQDTATYYGFPLDIKAMREASRSILGKNDFTSFTKVPSQTRTNCCTIYQASWELKGEEWVFFISADRFLRNMVRALVGTLLEVGRSRLSVDEFVGITEAKDRSEAGPSAPARGLYLASITYPKTIFHG